MLAHVILPSRRTGCWDIPLLEG
uniref:Uncharacterized protein n=1 Tax=Anguilla anguilla TaxID=7936 RepID=A0A0E9QDL2_ANGAN